MPNEVYMGSTESSPFIVNLSQELCLILLLGKMNFQSDEKFGNLY